MTTAEREMKTTIALVFLGAWFLALPAGWPQKYDGKDHAELGDV